MNNDMKVLLASKRIINDCDLEDYLMLLDHNICNDAERWCNKNTPTAKIYRETATKDLYFYVTWYIEFENKNDMVLYQLSK